MEHTSISDLSINLELSLDGRDYYQIDNLNITDRETVEKAMTLFLTELHRIDAKQQRLDFNSGNQLYLRLNRASKENYNDHLLKQSDLYESLTIKEKIIPAVIGPISTIINKKIL